MSEWREYRITVPNGSTSRATDGERLRDVHHVVHLPAARRILEDGRLKAGLIYDESRLNKSRTSVTWVSANTWIKGSIYGNIQFTFSWKSIIKDRDVYWVEAMPNYSPPAYRLLLVDRGAPAPKNVIAYNPTNDGGPLRRRDGRWYWNSDFTSEFMIEADIPMSLCTGFEFVSHHQSICRINRPCSDAGPRRRETAGRLIAFMLAQDIHAIDHVFAEPNQFEPDRALSNELDFGVEGILAAFRNVQFMGPLAKSSSADAALRGVLSLYGADQRRKARQLARLFKSRAIFEEALEAAIQDHFGEPSWQLP